MSETRNSGSFRSSSGEAMTRPSSTSGRASTWVRWPRTGSPDAGRRSNRTDFTDWIAAPKPRTHAALRPCTGRRGTVLPRWVRFWVRDTSSPSRRPFRLVAAVECEGHRGRVRAPAERPRGPFEPPPWDIGGHPAEAVVSGVVQPSCCRYARSCRGRRQTRTCVPTRKPAIPDKC